MMLTTRSRPSCTTACGCTRTRTPAAARRACSRRWRALRADQIGFYPPYAAATDAVREYLGVPPDSVALTNGLDEGIMALAVAYLRPSAGGFVPEAIVPEPAFEIFRFDTEVVGGRPVQVMPRRRFQLPARRRARRRSRRERASSS